MGPVYWLLVLADSGDEEQGELMYGVCTWGTPSGWVERAETLDQDAMRFTSQP